VGELARVRYPVDTVDGPEVAFALLGEAVAGGDPTPLPASVPWLNRSAVVKF